MPRTDSYWKPKLALSPTSNPETPARVGVVKGTEGQTFSLEVYRDLLAVRLQHLLEQEDDPEQALRDLVNQLEEQDLALNLPQELEPLSLATVLILDSGDLQQHLERLGVPGRLPEKFPANDPKAEKLYGEMSLENWLNALLEDQPNPDR